MSYACVSDEALDGEIVTLEAIVKTRLRRVTRDFAELEEQLRELRRERARRRERAFMSVSTEESVAATD